MENSNKTLKFTSELTQEILEGKKTTTWRLFDDKDLQEGDVLNLINSSTGKKFAKAEIVQIKEKCFDQVDDSDFEGHSRYSNSSEMLTEFRKYYGERVTMETMVKIITFKCK